MPKLKLKTGGEVLVPNERLEQALASGQYETPGADSPVAVQTDSGLLEVPFKDLARYQEQFGNQPASETELAAGAKGARQEREHGGVVGGTGAFLEGVVDTGTLGAYGAAADALLGPDYKKARQERAEVNPSLAIAGNVTGGVASALLTGGGSAAAEVGMAGKAAITAGKALTTPAGLAIKAGKAVEKALGSKLAGTAAGAATEGAIFGAGQAVSQATIHDEPLTAEALLVGSGLGALAGGFFGATGYGLGKASTALGKGKKYTGQEPVGTAQLKYADEPVGASVRKTSPDDFLPPGERHQPLVQANKAFDEQVDRVVAAVKADSGGVAAPQYDDLVQSFRVSEGNAADILEDAALQGKSLDTKLLSKYRRARADVGKGLPDSSFDPQGRPKLASVGGKEWANSLQPEHVKLLSKQLDALQDASAAVIKAAGGDPALVSAGHEAVSQFAKATPKAVDPVVTQALEELAALRKTVSKSWHSSDSISNTLAGNADKAQEAIGAYNAYLSKAEEVAKLTGSKESLALSDLRSHLDNAWASASNRGSVSGSSVDAAQALSDLAGAPMADVSLGAEGEDALRMALSESVKKANKGSASGLVTKVTREAAAVAGMTKDQVADGIMQGVSRVGGLLQAQGGVTSQIAHAVFQLAKKHAPKIAGVASKAERYARPGAAQTIARLGLDATKETSLPKQYEAQTQAIRNKVASLDATSSEIYEGLHDVRQASLGVADKMQQAKLNVLQFLAAKIPLDPGQMTSLFRSRWKPTSAQMEQFSLYVEGATNPVGVMQRAMAPSGRVTPQEAEAVRTLYPGIFAETHKQILLNLPAIQENASYEQQVRMGILFGMPVTSTSGPEAVNFYSQFHAAEQQAKQPIQIKQSMSPDKPTLAQSATAR